MNRAKSMRCGMNIERRRRWIRQLELSIAWSGVILPPIDDFEAMFRIYYHKRLLCVLRRVRRCPECRGVGRINEFEEILRSAQAREGAFWWAHCLTASYFGRYCT